MNELPAFSMKEILQMSPYGVNQISTHVDAWGKLFKAEHEKHPRPVTHWVEVFELCFGSYGETWGRVIRRDDMTKTPIGERVYLKRLPREHPLWNVPLIIDGCWEEQTIPNRQLDTANTKTPTGRYFYSFLEAPVILSLSEDISVIPAALIDRKKSPLPILTS